jgi:hypothetical protein
VLEKEMEAEDDDDGAWELGKKEVEEGLQIIENACKFYMYVRLFGIGFVRFCFHVCVCVFQNFKETHGLYDLSFGSITLVHSGRRVGFKVK